MHQGYDKLEFAAMGAASVATLDALEMARDTAKKLDHDLPTTIGKLKCNVAPHGSSAKQGYAYRVHTGKSGLSFMIKRSVDKQQWNLYCEVSAQTLATTGLKSAIAECMQGFSDMEISILQISVNRIDYCVDVQMDEDGTLPKDGFQLKVENFVAQSRVTRSVEWGDDDMAESLHLRVNSRKRIETVTLGKNPNLQVQTYDKRVQALTKHLWHYFDIWGKDKKNCPTIWRVEVRLYKDHLKDWNIRTFEDVYNSIGDVFRSALLRIRYVNNPNISNISRAENHPLWDIVCASVDEGMKENYSGIIRGRILETERDEKEKEIIGAALGNIWRLSTVQGLSFENAKETLPDIVKKLIEKEFRTEPDKIKKSRKKADAQLHFITKKENANG